MGMLSELNELLDRMPLWKRLTRVPDELDVLRERVAALEARLEKPHGDTCPMCREPTMLMTGLDKAKSRPHMGLLIDNMKCSSCGYEEPRTRLK